MGTAQYKFVEYQSLYDPDIKLFALAEDAVIKEIDGAMFIEATPNFKDVQMVRMDSLKTIGYTFKRY